MKAEKRFWSKVLKTKSCWLWTAGLQQQGYGQFWDGNKNRRVHRYAWELKNGPISNSRLVIDHLCRVRHCVNPNHMELVSNKENVLRGTGITANFSKRDCCKNGHKFNVENTRYSSRKGSHNYRICRKCGALNDRTYRARLKEKMGDK